MSFTVDVASLAGLPPLLDRLAEDAQASRAYGSKHLDLGAGEGIFNLVLGGHREVVAQVEIFFSSVDAVADQEAGQVHDSLARYRRTDLATAAKFDATLPGVTGAPWLASETGRSSGFADRSEPQSHLTPPHDYAADYDLEMKWHSYLSPTSYVRDLIWEVTGLAVRLGICDRQIDIFTEWLKPWLGDWAGFRACADVHENLGRTTVAMTANVRNGSVDSQFVWTGNAAGACRRDLNKIGTALEQAEPKLNELSAEYKSVAESTFKLADSVAGLMVVAVDLALLALLELEAAAASAPTVVGAAAFGGAAAVTIWKLIETAGKILDCIKVAEYGAKGFTSALAGFSVIDPKGPLPSLSTVPVPPGGHKFN